MTREDVLYAPPWVLTAAAIALATPAAVLLVKRLRHGA